MNEDAGGSMGFPGDREMSLTWRRTAWVFIATLALDCSAALGQEVTGSFERTLAIDGPIQLDVATGSGSIVIRSGNAGRAQIVGRIVVRRGSVSLVQTAPGDVIISTGSGGSDVKGIEGALRIRSGSGSITAEGTQHGLWDLQADSGSINIRLPPDAAFDLDAEGHSGEVYTDHPVAVQRRIARGRLSGQVRGGGPLLRVRTGSGGIRIQ